MATFGVRLGAMRGRFGTDNSVRQFMVCRLPNVASWIKGITATGVPQSVETRFSFTRLSPDLDLLSYKHHDRLVQGLLDEISLFHPVGGKKNTRKSTMWIE